MPAHQQFCTLCFRDCKVRTYLMKLWFGFCCKGRDNFAILSKQHNFEQMQHEMSSRYICLDWNPTASVGRSINTMQRMLHSDFFLWNELFANKQHTTGINTDLLSSARIDGYFYLLFLLLSANMCVCCCLSSFHTVKRLCELDWCACERGRMKERANTCQTMLCVRPSVSMKLVENARKRIIMFCIFVVCMCIYVFYTYDLWISIRSVRRVVLWQWKRFQSLAPMVTDDIVFSGNTIVCIEWNIKTALFFESIFRCRFTGFGNWKQKLITIDRKHSNSFQYTHSTVFRNCFQLEGKLALHNQFWHSHFQMSSSVTLSHQHTGIHWIVIY